MSLRQAFLSEIIRKAHIIEENNWDYLRHGPEKRLVEAEKGGAWFEYIVDHWRQFEAAHDQLADLESRDLMIQLLQFHVLGHLHVKLPTNTPSFWEQYQACQQYVIEPAVAHVAALNITLDLMRFDGITFVGHPLGLLANFFQRQYWYDKCGHIQPEAGDVVIDAGACWADTSLAFAESVGATGRIHAFEISEANFSLAKRNLAYNPTLASRIDLRRQALTARSGDTFRFTELGPASRSLPGTGQESVETITIDDYVASTGLSKVDFIKMDVEGGELQALKGAEQTIRQHRPKLAISVYHQPQDLFEIPGWITRVCPEYRLHLDHYTLFAEETVLYASTRGNM